MRQKSILALMTYTVVGSMPIRIFREMRRRGLDVAVSYYVDATGQYTHDPMTDFREAGRMLDMTDYSPLNYAATVDSFIREHDVGLVIQIGCEPLYPWLAWLKQRNDGLFIQDMLFNEVGHTVSHFLFENAIDEAIVESGAMRAFIEGNSTKDHPAIRVLLSGVDIEEYAPALRDNSNDEFVVGYVGRMSAEKNPLGFVEIAERLAEADGRLKFRIFGEGAMSAEVAARAASSRFAKQIEFVGYVEHVTMALHQIDVLVVPSVLDGRPNIIMEANACGVPVIGNPVGGIPEMIVPGANGFLFSPAETDRMSSLLAGWRGDRAAYLDARGKARSFAETSFSRQRMMDDYESAFRARLVRS